MTIPLTAPNPWRPPPLPDLIIPRFEWPHFNPWPHNPCDLPLMYWTAADRMMTLMFAIAEWRSTLGGGSPGGSAPAGYTEYWDSNASANGELYIEKVQTSTEVHSITMNGSTAGALSVWGGQEQQAQVTNTTNEPTRVSQGFTQFCTQNGRRALHAASRWSGWGGATVNKHRYQIPGSIATVDVADSIILNSLLTPQRLSTDVAYYRDGSQMPFYDDLAAVVGGTDCSAQANLSLSMASFVPIGAFGSTVFNCLARRFHITSDPATVEGWDQWTYEIQKVDPNIVTASVSYAAATTHYWMNDEGLIWTPGGANVDPRYPWFDLRSCWFADPSIINLAIEWFFAQWDTLRYYGVTVPQVRRFTIRGMEMADLVDWYAWIAEAEGLVYARIR